jgi:hypothetical protein
MFYWVLFGFDSEFPKSTYGESRMDTDALTTSTFLTIQFGRPAESLSRSTFKAAVAQHIETRTSPPLSHKSGHEKESRKADQRAKVLRSQASIDLTSYIAHTTDSTQQWA